MSIVEQLQQWLRGAEKEKDRAVQHYENASLVLRVASESVDDAVTAVRQLKAALDTVSRLV